MFTLSGNPSSRWAAAMDKNKPRQAHRIIDGTERWPWIWLGFIRSLRRDSSPNYYFGLFQFHNMWTWKRRFPLIKHCSNFHNKRDLKTTHIPGLVIPLSPGTKESMAASRSSKISAQNAKSIQDYIHRVRDTKSLMYEALKYQLLILAMAVASIFKPETKEIRLERDPPAHRALHPNLWNQNQDSNQSNRHWRFRWGSLQGWRL